MIQVVSEKKALKVLDGYYELLSKTGYVPHKTLKYLMIYMFLLDFVEYLHEYITEDDYQIIERLLVKLFANGGCLFPYPVFCTRRATLKTNKAILSKNKPYDGYSVRLTENDINNSVNHPLEHSVQ